MSTSRLTTALKNGAVALPTSGRIAVFRPRTDTDLSPLSRDRTHIIQGFKPDHDYFAAQGYDTGVAPSDDYAASFICMTRSKTEARVLVAAARACSDGPILIDGQKMDGIESLLRAIRKRVDVGEVTSKAHGKLFAFQGGNFNDWATNPDGQQIADGFNTSPGVFSADGIDRGSQLLAEALPTKLPNRIADLGAGWGYLSREVLMRDGVDSLDIIEAEHAALECARRNVPDLRATSHWADVTQYRPDKQYDAVITNPPFHTSRAAEPQIGKAFISSAARMLTSGGKLWLVANRHLPYETEAAIYFHDVQEIAGNGGFC